MFIMIGKWQIVNNNYNFWKTTQCNWFSYAYIKRMMWICHQSHLEKRIGSILYPVKKNCFSKKIKYFTYLPTLCLTTRVGEGETNIFLKVAPSVQTLSAFGGICHVLWPNSCFFIFCSIFHLKDQNKNLIPSKILLLFPFQISCCNIIRMSNLIFYWENNYTV